MKKLLNWSFEQQKCIDMIYQNDKGQFTQRIIRVIQIQDEHIRAYCYLRKRDRLFKLDNILSVATIQKNRVRGA